MSEMAKRVAQAIADVWCDKPGNTEAARLFEKTARDAIAAIREPTPEMCAAGVDTGAVSNDTYFVGNDHVATVYKAMIDEALK